MGAGHSAPDQSGRTTAHVVRMRSGKTLIVQRAYSGALFDAPRRVAESAAEDLQGGLTEDEKKQNLLHLGFGGRQELFDAFCRAVEDVVPPGTMVVMRGSSITGRRWRDNAPFDADGPGTSDLDLTLVGDGALLFFSPTGFWVPGIHSRPLSDEDPDIAPELVPLRNTLIEMVKRPVNIQASRDIVIQVRGDMFGQPYLKLFDKPAGLSLSGSATRA